MHVVHADKQRQSLCEDASQSLNATTGISVTTMPHVSSLEAKLSGKWWNYRGAFQSPLMVAVCCSSALVNCSASITPPMQTSIWQDSSSPSRLPSPSPELRELFLPPGFTDPLRRRRFVRDRVSDWSLCGVMERSSKNGNSWPARTSKNSSIFRPAFPISVSGWEIKEVRWILQREIKENKLGCYRTLYTGIDLTIEFTNWKWLKKIIKNNYNSQFKTNNPHTKAVLESTRPRWSFMWGKNSGYHTILFIIIAGIKCGWGNKTF